MIRQSVVCHLKKNLFRRYHKFPQTKARLDGPALASLDTRPGQSPHEAGYLAWLGLAYFGLALAGSRPQAGPGKTLRATHNSSLLCGNGLQAHTRVSNWSQTCSIIFISRLDGGHGKHLTFFFWNHASATLH